MKKLLLLFSAFWFLAGCSDSHAFNLNRESQAEVAKEERVSFKIGVALDATGGIEDNTFNAMGWSGINQYIHRYPSTKVQSSMAKRDNDMARLDVMEELISVKSDIIFGFGSSFKNAVQEYQWQYPEIKFVLLGGELPDRGPNTASIDFEDQQSAFLAGIAAALNSQTGNIGFYGGAEIETVRRQQLGFEAGIQYANAHLGTQAALSEIEYGNSFSAIKAGQEAAKKIYASGADVLFACAGSSGMGAMNEAKVLTERGNEVWLIGVDNDLYTDGKIFSGPSVVLTSAMKRLDIVMYEILEAYVRGHFPAGEHFIRNISNHGVGLPPQNPNFNDETASKVSLAEAALKEEKLRVPFDLKQLEAFVELQKQSDI